MNEAKKEKEEDVVVITIDDNTAPSAEQVEAWKREYKGRVKCIRVAVDMSVYGSEGVVEHLFYFKPVERSIKSLADKKLIDENRQINAEAYGEIIVAGHILNGRNVFESDADVRYALLAKADQIISSATATLVKS